MKYKKVAITPTEELKDFMAGVGFTLKASEPTTYTRKDGKVVKATKLSFSNGKSYLATASRFWKQQ
jgi:hypothetical protein